MTHPLLFLLSGHPRLFCITKGGKWNEDYRASLAKHRNIHHIRNFKMYQREMIEDYHYANLLLVNCLNESNTIDRELREKIEETLLLPIEEIERRKRERVE
jgi:hypothetical protein